MTKPILYTMPGTCALAPNIAIAWLEAPVIVQNMDYGDHRNDHYLSVNAQGKVPALPFDDGDVLTDAAAECGDWDRDHLECVLGEPRRPRPPFNRQMLESRYE